MKRQSRDDIGNSASQLALTATAASGFVLALASQGKAPASVQLLPAGRVETNDGRWFDNTAPEGIVEAFLTGGLDLPFDFEHGSELRAPQGEFVPAAGWITALENRNGSIWAAVDWTARGRAAIEAREVRYVSPAFLYNFETLQILSITSAALTVRPAITVLPALTTKQPQKESVMDKKALCAALGLPETASDADILAAVAKSKEQAARASSAPSLDSYVPRADYETVRKRADDAEAALASQQSAGLKAEATNEIERGIKEGKIAPASKDYYLGTCSSREGLDAFKKFLASAVPVVPVAPAGTAPAAPPANAAGAGTALTSTQRKVAAGLGMSEADYAKQLEAEKGAA